MTLKEIENYLKDNHYLYGIENNQIYLSHPIFKTLNLLKTDNKMTIEWLLNKLNQNNYKNMVCIFKEILNKDIETFAVYPTTYGIGIFVTNFKNTDLSIQEIRNFLNRNNINYKWEYSNKNYVYRFKISKTKENLNKIKELKNGRVE